MLPKNIELLALFLPATLFGVGLASPLAQGGYAVPTGPGNGKCAGSDGNKHSDVLACPGNPDAVKVICHGDDWNPKTQMCGKQGDAYRPICINGNFCTGVNPTAWVVPHEGAKKVDMIDYYNDSGCNCNG